MTSDEERAADRMIDEALARYASAEPLAGIEERVLERVRAARARRSALQRWALAAAVAAAAVLLLTLRPVRTPRIVHRPPVEIAHSVTPVPHFARPRIEVRRPRPRHRAWRPFPTPAPISPEEQALLTLADAPPRVRDVLIEKQEIEEIRIAPLKIEPLK